MGHSRICLCTVGHSAKPIATAQNYTAIFVKLAKSFEVIVMLKNVCMYINSTYQDLYHPRFKPKVSGKNLKFEYLGKFKDKFK
jgi:hypothetical protein